MEQEFSLHSQAHAGDVDAQYLLGIEYMKSGLQNKAQRWLARAAQQEHGAALLALARIQMVGLGTDVQPDAVLSLLERALAAGQHIALGHIATIQAVAATRTGNWQPLVETLVAASLSGSGTSCRQLALMVRDTHQQRQLLQHAYDRQDLLSARLLAALAITESDADEAAYWISRSDNPPRVLTGPRTHSLSKEPFTPSTPDDLESLLRNVSLAGLPEHRIVHTVRVQSIPHAVSAALCEYWIALAEPRLSESLVWNPYTGKAQRDAMRSNEFAALGPEMTDAVTLYWRAQLASLAGLPESHAEWLSILHYRPGDQYQPHFDFLTPQHQDFTHGGHRRDTVLVYLNEGFGGGATDFPRLKLTITPRVGDVLHFCSMTENGALDQESLHAGLPVESDEKWVASLWLRERPYR